MNSLTKEEVVQQDLAHKYLHGRLSEEQTASFELLLMENPDMVEQLQIDRLLQAHVKQLEAKRPSIREVWHQIMDKPIYYACTFALAFVLGVYISPALTTDEKSGLQGNIEIAYVSSLRGDSNSPDTVVSLNDEVDTLLLVLQPSTQQKLDYLVTVTAQEKQLKLIEGATYSTNDFGEIMLPMGKSRLNPGLIKIDFAPIGQPSLQESLVVKLTRQKT